jgi:hypothetical protein
MHGRAVIGTKTASPPQNWPHSGVVAVLLSSSMGEWLGYWVAYSSI